MHQHKTPTNPWQYISADLFKMAENEFLLVADQYSWSPFIWQLRSTSSAAIIKNIKVIFEERGIPEIVYTDNGLQFKSKEFADFSTTYSFLHKTCSPHSLKSNGFAERMVGVYKRILLKERETAQDSYLVMIACGTIPMSSNARSPAQNCWMVNKYRPHWCQNNSLGKNR